MVEHQKVSKYYGQDCSSESDFEANSFEKKEIDVFSRENELSDSLPERFSNILPYQFEPEKKENAEETLCLLLWLKSRIAGKASHHQLLWATAQLLVTRVSLMYLVDEFLFLFLV